MGFNEKQIDPVQLSVFEQFLACLLLSEKRAEFVVATVKISVRLKNGSTQLTLKRLSDELSENITLFWVKCLRLSIFSQTFS